MHANLVLRVIMRLVMILSALAIGLSLYGCDLKSKSSSVVDSDSLKSNNLAAGKIYLDSIPPGAEVLLLDKEDDDTEGIDLNQRGRGSTHSEPKSLGIVSSGIRMPKCEVGTVA